jgi:hypothetical protein
MTSCCLVCFKELVPCVLLSFDNAQILIYRGKGWKSQYPSFKLKFEMSERNLQSNPSISGFLPYILS